MDNSMEKYDGLVCSFINRIQDLISCLLLFVTKHDTQCKKCKKDNIVPYPIDSTLLRVNLAAAAVTEEESI
jgi:hypothetical protein